MIRERFGETGDFNWMQPCQFAAGRLELHGCSVSREVADVGPVKHFNWSLCADKSRRSQPTPESLETHVGSCYTPVAGGFDNLYVVDTNHAFAIHVDQLFVQYISCEQDFAFPTDERA